MRTLTICVFVMLLWGCSEKAVYSHTIDFENGIWKFQDPSVFDFEIIDKSNKYNLYLDIDHNADYPFENLYLRIKTQFPDESIATDTLSIEMVDNQGGWVGDCGNEDCDLTVFLQERTMFKDNGSHQLTIEQFTRQNDLRGINSMRFRVDQWSE